MTFRSLAASLALGLVVVSAAEAGELREFYRGSRANAMGNAFTAIADDDQAIFMNPAGLAGIQKTQFNYLSADLMSTGDVVQTYLDGGMSAISNIGKSSGEDLVNLIMGKHISSSAQLTSSLVMPNLGVGVIVDQQISLNAVNKALPRLTVGYQTTNGIQAASGFTVARLFKKRAEVRVGGAAKVLWRRGGFRNLPTLTVLNLDRGRLNAITGSFGRGLGVDLGAQYIHKINKRFTVSSGISFTDVGDTNFGGEPQPIKGNLSWGLAASYEFAKVRTTLAYDYRHILEVTDWRKKNHLGLEVALPMLSLYGGINQVNFTYGIAFDAWLFRITALSYAEEDGSFVHQNTERRYVLRTALKFNL